jgi:hypothetical protein
MKTLRILVSAVTAAFLTGQMLASARASSVTFNLALTPSFGLEGGTGSLTVNGPVGSKIFTPGSGGLTSLNLFVDGSDFTLANALPGTSATFLNGVFESLTYVGILGGDTLTISGLSYVFTDTNPLQFSGGIVSDPPPSATPLPPTWAMMLIGLAGFGLLLCRRNGRATFAGVLSA